VDVWESVKAATAVLGADTVSLRFVERSRPGSLRTRHFADGLDGVEVPFFRTRHSLMVERPHAGLIELGWKGQSTINRDTEMAVEQLCGYVRNSLERVSRLDAEDFDDRIEPARVANARR